MYWKVAVTHILVAVKKVGGEGLEIKTEILARQ